jgi:VWFA-related protein
MTSFIDLHRFDSSYKPGDAVFKTSESSVNAKIVECRTIAVWLLALFAITAAAPWACAQAPAQPASQTVDITKNVDEVSLDLVVHDKKNKPVLDLRQGEISVTDNRVPVALNNLQLVSSDQPGVRLITLVFDQPTPVAGQVKQSDPAIMKNAREAAAKIFKLFPEKNFSFSVLSVEGRLRLQSGFTSDRNTLTQAVNTATRPPKELNQSDLNDAEKQLIVETTTGVAPTGKAASAVDRALAKTLFSALKDSGTIMQNQHIRPFLAGLLAISQSQQQIIQRKAIIFFTSFQGEHIDLRTREAMTSIVGSANKAGESIYIIDLNSSDSQSNETSQQDANVAGLTPGSSSAAGGLDGATGMSGTISKLGMNGYLGHIENERNNDDMKSLAVGTGGSLFNHNHLQKSLEQILQDMTTYYVASYDPQIKEYDGRFRPVTVKSLRAGLKIRTQSGYSAVPPHYGADARPQPFEIPLLKTLTQTPLPADVPFHAAILNLGDQPEGKVSTVAIEAPYSSLEIHDDPATEISTASLSILALVKDQSGMVIERFSEDIPRRRIAKKASMDQLGAISFVRHFNSPPGKYILEAVVTDHYSGKSGAQHSTFEIPNTSGTPTLSNLLLVRNTEVVHPEDDPSEPLRRGNTRVIPNLSGQLLPNAKDVSIFFTARSYPHAAEPASISIQVFFDGKPLGGQPMLAHPESGHEFSSFLMRFSISPAQDGQYEVKATLKQGGITSESNTSFTLTGSAAASENASAAQGSLPVPDIPKGPLKISVSTNTSNQPTPEEIKSILADATKYAMAYRESLPNFMCEQATDHSINISDPWGGNKWTHKNKVTELLTFFEHRESRLILDEEISDAAGRANQNSVKAIDSAGEFGFALTGLFRPESRADFQWKETGMIEDGTVQIFDYRVARENSNFNLRQSSSDVIKVGYHGQVIIDNATRTVRRITQIVDDVPLKFPIKGVSVSIDYDYVVINNHDYMLPIGAQLITRTGPREMEMNEIAYRNFRRFSATSKIIFDPDAVK